MVVCTDFSLDPPCFESLAKCGSPYKIAVDEFELQQAVEFCARCCKRELQFDRIPFRTISDRNNANIEVYVFHEMARDMLSEGKPILHRVIGACAFEILETLQDKKWRMTWVWFHPFARGRKHLTNAWRIFEERYSNFQLLGPLSIGMDRFLCELSSKHKHTITY